MVLPIGVAKGSGEVFRRFVREPRAYTFSAGSFAISHHELPHRMQGKSFSWIDLLILTVLKMTENGRYPLNGGGGVMVGRLKNCAIFFPFTCSLL